MTASVSEPLLADLVAGVALIVGSVVLFGLAIWFAIVFIAPRINRAVERTDPTVEEPSDRAD